MLRPSVDLTSCDAEPIHRIGAIQPNGALLAADAESLEILFASANAEAYFGWRAEALLGRGLDALLGEEVRTALLATPLEPFAPDILKPYPLILQWPSGRTVSLECYPHLYDGRIVLEFVHRKALPEAVWEEDLVRQRIISSMIRPDTLEELARVGADIVREVTGFDRVMIYRFAPDKHGEVIGESTARPDSWLGLHYPASDIPDPARRHFILNVIRSIPDVEAVHIPILARAAGAELAPKPADKPLDLTFSKLRAVAPVHVEYLGNMGVKASMSISLIAHQELWGLVACHHYQPRHISWSRLRFCELIGGTISALLQSLENTTQLRHSIEAEKTAFHIEREARQGRALPDVVERHAQVLMAETACEAIVLTLGGRIHIMGETPLGLPDEAVLTGTLRDGIATCDSLPVPIMAEGSNGAFAGAAMLELSEDGADRMILLRREHEHEIAWAGKPEKSGALLPDGTLRLSPRGSFALWREERRGRSKPFTATDDEVLRITRRTLFAINSLDRERAAVAAQLEAEAAAMRLRLVLLESARSRSMGELASALAHELNQPLSAATNYVNACRQELRNYGLPLPEKIGRLMDSALSESSRAADLVRRLRDLISQGHVSREHADLGDALRQGVDLALAASHEPRPELVFEFEHHAEAIWIDPVQIAQVVLNLARNSLEAMQGRTVRRLVLRTVQNGEAIEVSIADTGSGIAPDLLKTLFEPFHRSTTHGMGIGLSLCRSIVEAHGGRIWVRPSGEGAEFVFTLECRRGADA